MNCLFPSVSLAVLQPNAACAEAQPLILMCALVLPGLGCLIPLKLLIKLAWHCTTYVGLFLHQLIQILHLPLWSSLSTTCTEGAFLVASSAFNLVHKQTGTYYNLYYMVWVSITMKRSSKCTSGYSFYACIWITAKLSQCLDLVRLHLIHIISTEFVEWKAA